MIIIKRRFYNFRINGGFFVVFFFWVRKYEANFRKKIYCPVKKIASLSSKQKIMKISPQRLDNFFNHKKETKRKQQIKHNKIKQKLTL